MVHFQSFTTLTIPIFGKPTETHNVSLKKIINTSYTCIWFKKKYIFFLLHKGSLPYVLQTLTTDSPKWDLENGIMNFEIVEEKDERIVPCKVCKTGRNIQIC